MTVAFPLLCQHTLFRIIVYTCTGNKCLSVAVLLTNKKLSILISIFFSHLCARTDFLMGKHVLTLKYLDIQHQHIYIAYLENEKEFQKYLVFLSFYLT